MQITVLNGAYARDGGSLHSLGPLPRAVLLALVSEGDVTGPIPAERLLSLVWDAQPSNDRGALHQAVHRLRSVLGDRIVGDRRTGTYEFRAQPGDYVDLWTYRAMARICVQRSHSDPYAAVPLWERTLSRWPLTALRGLPTTPEMAELIRTLDAERIRGTEKRAEVQLKLGQHDQVVVELGQLVERYWQREHLRGLLMTALYRQQRGGEAIALFDRYQRRLNAAHPGTRPGRAIRDLTERIARADHALLEPESPALPAGDRAVADSGANPADLSVARMCVALLDSNPATAYTTFHDRAACLTVLSLERELSRLEAENMEFGNRLARHATITRGITRFVELGALPPAWYSLHTSAHLANPGAQVVYTAYDQALVEYSRQQLISVEGVEFIHGTLLHPQRILAQPAIRNLIQLHKPVSERDPIVLIDRHELNTLPTNHDLRALYSVLMEQAGPGSLFAVTAPTPEGMSPEVERHLVEVFLGNDHAERVVHMRTAQQVLEVVPDGLEVLPPGVTDSFNFWPEPGAPKTAGPWRQNSVVATKR